MPGFLYFCESNKVPDMLGYAFEPEPQSPREIIGPGPNGRAGWIFGGPTYDHLPQRYGYYPDLQTWHQIPNSEIWIGYLNAAMPNEQCLRRSKMIPGQSVKLLNGESWQIPIARSWNEKGEFTVELPRLVGMNHAGQIVATNEVVPEYRQLYELACKIYDTMSESLDDNGDGELTINFEDCFKIFETNYLMSAIEVTVLKLISTENSWELAQAIIDLNSHPSLKKKLVPGTSSSNDGPTVETPVIAQP